jgi:hypothetical protein
MNGSPRQQYILDIYHQPPGYQEPVVKEQHRLLARNDAEAITESRAMFLDRDTGYLTGFAVRSIGSRRFGEQAIYRS